MSGLTRDSMVSGLLRIDNVWSRFGRPVRSLLSSTDESCCDRVPSLDRGKWDDNNAFAALTLELQSLSAHLSDELTALAAGLVTVGGTVKGRRANHWRDVPLSR